MNNKSSNWHTTISYVLTFFSFVFGFYWYTAALREIDPTFITEVNTQQILSKQLLLKAPLRISKSNGESISSNVFSQTFYFFNQGKEALTTDKILENLFISLDDSTAEILDFKILKASREVAKCKLNLDSAGKNLFIDFKILEEDDGFAGQIIYSSDNENSKIVLHGTIAGAPDGFSTFYKSKIGIPPFVLSIIWILSPFIPLLLIQLYIKKYGRKIDSNEQEDDKPFSRKPKKTISNWLTSRYQLVIRNEKNFAEKTSVGFTYSKVILFSVILFSIIFIVSLFLSKTLLAKWFDPRFKPKYEGTVTIPDSLK